ncbi:hypothetical protein [Niallia sp. BSM11]|uniref:hypothetical protein n=1 Tax=Niallia sp. BSM11 TaxID=3391576 RepID=UPI0039852A01
MHTQYIKYLQSMNNANSSNDNAIAESQFSNSFYENIRVERKIGSYLIQKIANEKLFIVLTGHAGDGKTSLLHQILRQINAVPAGEPLKEEDTVLNKLNDQSLYYVKDMSELISDSQKKCIQKGVDTVKNDGSSIIVSNTGPLIDAFKNYYRNSEFSESEIEMEILKLMDENSFKEGIIGNISVLVINLALLDNTDVVPFLIDNLLNEELWKDSETCELGTLCPIYNNYVTLKRHQEKFKRFVVNYYRWLADNDKRLTIRQILSHLSYAITGNLQCQELNIINRRTILFDYHISNLFFGYIGLIENNDALKIKSITELKKMKLDEKKLVFDHEFFVKENFNVLVEEVRSITKNTWDHFMRRRLLNTEQLLYEKEPFLIRKAMRRMGILFAEMDEKQEDYLYGILYSPIYPNYLSYRKNGMRIRSKRHLKEIIFKALQVLIMGDSSAVTSESVLYLPLKRSGFNNQNVYLLVGKIDYDSIIVDAEQIENLVSDEQTYCIYMKFTRLSQSYTIPLPLLDYFYQVANGSLSTKLNPVLSQGIHRLKAQLYKEYRFTDGDEVIKLLIQTLQGPKIIDIEIDSDNKKLYFD